MIFELCLTLPLNVGKARPVPAAFSGIVILILSAIVFFQAKRAKEELRRELLCKRRLVNLSVPWDPFVYAWFWRVRFL